MIDEIYYAALTEGPTGDKACGCGPDCDCGPDCACGPNGKCDPACTCAPEARN